MTVERSYTENELRRVGAAIHLSGYLDRVITLSTPDPRLQAIKDMWNARNKYQREDIYGYWPEFSDLMDGALKKDNDERNV